MINYFRKEVTLLLILLLIFATVSLTFASGAKEESDIKDPVEIPLLLRNSGNDSGMKLTEYNLDKFEEEFGDKYKIVPEWMPGVATDLRAKFKMLNASNDLPAIVWGLNGEPAFAELLIENNRLMDLKPYFDASPEWRDVCIPESIDFNTKDGKMYTAPSASASYIGIFYNKEYFEDAGIKAFPTTWDEFWDVCEKLDDAGYTPLSLHTTETGWASMLLATSFLALSDEGMKFMDQMFPTNFNTPVMKEAMLKLRKLFDYTTPDAVGGNYALAANNFTSGKTAMIANGPWMIPSLSDTQFAPEGFEENVGYGHFPGGVMLSWLGLQYGEGISMDQPIEVREGALEYIKMTARPVNIRKAGVISGSFSPNVPLTPDDLTQLSPAMQEYAKTVTSLKKTLIVYQTRWDPITQNEIIPNELPNFVTDKITVDELLNKMTSAGKKYAEESN